MLLIGLTGGIGSGKSTVAKLFKKLGVPCYIADDEAKKLINTSEEIKAEIINLLGEQSYKDGSYNTKFVANIVFNDPKKLSTLNAIIHPRVQRDFEEFCRRNKSDYIIYESALLLNNLLNKKRFDYLVSVIAPLELKISRIQQRDGSSRKEIETRIKFQVSDQYLQEHSDFVIENIELRDTENTVKELHDHFLTHQQIHNK